MKKPAQHEGSPVKKVRKARINGKPIKISWKLKEKWKADIDTPSTKNREIRINLDKHKRNHKDLMDSIIHEMLHGFRWKWSETKVKKCAGELTDLLWRAGFRLR